MTDATCVTGIAYHSGVPAFASICLLVLVGFVLLMLSNYVSWHFLVRVVMSAAISASPLLYWITKLHTYPYK